MFIDQLEHWQDKLLDRKNKLLEFAEENSSVAEIAKLLSDIDEALLRIQNGTFGICEVCKDPIEPDRLEADPLLTFCLDHLTTNQQRNLEDDLRLAAKIQKNMLPPKDLLVDGWDVAFHYEPAEYVSGDYCDIMTEEHDPFYMIIGDVTGKGIAAAMLMNHLHALFHTLVPLKLGSNDIMERMNRVLSESVISGHFATLLLAIIRADGSVNLSNAGHCRPIVYSGQTILEVDSNGIPLGVLAGTKYACTAVTLNKGDVLFLYSDGLIEAIKNEDMYGTERLLTPSFDLRNMTSAQIIENTLKDLHSFLDGTKKNDDLTIMVLKKL